MKRFLSIVLVISMLSGARLAAQPLMSLSDNFNAECVTSTGFPAHWIVYNTLTTTMPQGQWTCSPDGGRWGTPGMQCTGVYSASYHLDTSYLVSPAINLSWVTDSVYLVFDLKADSILLGGKFDFVAFFDTPFSINHPQRLLDDSLRPAFSVVDSGEWVTHLVNITSCKDSGDFYIAFRYISTDTTGSILYLDNVLTTETNALRTPSAKINTLPVSVIGMSVPDDVRVRYMPGTAGNYTLEMYDMLGRCIYNELLYGGGGGEPATVSLTGLGLPPGMYLVKISNGNCYGVARTVVY